jgi:hypothetical protein
MGRNLEYQHLGSPLGAPVEGAWMKEAWYRRTAAGKQYIIWLDGSRRVGVRRPVAREDPESLPSRPLTNISRRREQW